MHPDPADYFKKQVEALKLLEIYSYQTAYYILQNEELAIEATITALLEINKVDDFYTKSPTIQRDIMKKTIFKKSIAVKQKSLNCVNKQLISGE